MTPTAAIPNFSEALILIHRVITRGLSVAEIRGTEFLQTGYPDPQLRQGYANYLHSLTSVLGAHHLGEDEIAFPSLKERLPFAPYMRLSSDHQLIETKLGFIVQAVTDINGEGTKAGLSNLVDVLHHVSSIWKPHIRMEEQNFSQDAIEKAMTLDEQRSLSEALGKHNQEHASPPHWVLPFVLFNLNVEDRAYMAMTFPQPVIEELIPKVWKEQWVSMKPFLLD